jgi:hypothetical protein
VSDDVDAAGPERGLASAGEDGAVDDAAEGDFPGRIDRDGPRHRA